MTAIDAVCPNQIYLLSFFSHSLYSGIDYDVSLLVLLDVNFYLKISNVFILLFIYHSVCGVMFVL